MQSLAPAPAWYFIANMPGSYLRRRAFLIGALRASTLSATTFLVQEGTLSAEQARDASFGPVFGPLDDFIQAYMRAMNSPGLTLALADKDRVVRTAAFGFSDLETKAPVTPDLLFEVGSITKSFVALTLLQLRGEGKLDLDRPVLEYLPWLPIEANHGVITVHHLLTHTSGLPDALGLFLSDPRARHVQAFKPGEHFHYCNVGFTALGYLVEKLDGRPWAEAVQKRIFEPLGMTSSAPVITNRTREKTANSYVPFFDDLTYIRHGKLAPAGNLVFEDAAGSILSTPGDMALYLQMLLRRGQGRGRRIVSEESFALFSKPYVKAPALSPTACYGYGIGVDQLDGHTVLRHTGGMVSFMSAMHIDLDGGVAAFASINAGQGYRPNPVTQFAVKLMCAQAERKPLPKPPELSDPMHVKNASEYAGTYTSPEGREVVVIAEGDRLTMRVGAESIPLQSGGGDTFLAIAPAFERFPILFGRAEENPKEKEHANEKDAKTLAPVIEMMHGADWYVNAKYSGPRSFAVPPDLAAFTGYYRAESVWLGSTRVVIRKGALWLDGVARLERLGQSLFRIGEEPYNPDTAEFFYPVEGKTQLLKLNGADLWRIDIS
ncbi:MAG: serine hydrolase [Acidobacteriaceae bacterium]|nr:serine hydrolase [Acidobacteriaceae bacterium]MBV9779667.1 serine hydrolase [Acidobacteriaceae bacterium]